MDGTTRRRKKRKHSEEQLFRWHKRSFVVTECVTEKRPQWTGFTLPKAEACVPEIGTRLCLEVQFKSAARMDVRWTVGELDNPEFYLEGGVWKPRGWGSVLDYVFLKLDDKVDLV